MIRVAINPGICSMNDTVEVVKVGKQRVRIEITSGCEMVTMMGESLVELDVLDDLKPPVNSKVYKCVSECHLCASYAVPMAILEAIEVEAGLALPRSVLIQFEATEKG